MNKDKGKRQVATKITQLPDGVQLRMGTITAYSDGPPRTISATVGGVSVSGIPILDSVMGFVGANIWILSMGKGRLLGIGHTNAAPMAVTESQLYAPVLTNVAIGTGGSAANAARYTYVGGPSSGDRGIMHCYGQVVLGTTGESVTGAVTIGMPPGFTFLSGTNTRSIGRVRLSDDDTPANTRIGTVTPSGNAIRPILGDSDNAPANIGATVPFTWDSNDQMVYDWCFGVERT